jgi:hypothetical protein
MAIALVEVSVRDFGARGRHVLVKSSLAKRRKLVL